MGLSAKPYPSFEIFRKDFLSSTSCLSRCSFLSRILSSIRARNHDVCTSRNLWLCLAVLRTNSSIKSSLLFSHWVALLLSELHIKGIWNLTTAPVRVLDIMISGNDDVSFHVSTLSPDQSASFYRLARLCQPAHSPSLAISPTALGTTLVTNLMLGVQSPEALHSVTRPTSWYIKSSSFRLGGRISYLTCLLLVSNLSPHRHLLLTKRFSGINKFHQLQW